MPITHDRTVIQRILIQEMHFGKFAFWHLDDKQQCTLYYNWALLAACKWYITKCRALTDCFQTVTWSPDQHFKQTWYGVRRKTSQTMTLMTNGLGSAWKYHNLHPFAYWAVIDLILRIFNHLKLPLHCMSVKTTLWRKIIYVEPQPKIFTYIKL